MLFKKQWLRLIAGVVQARDVFIKKSYFFRRASVKRGIIFIFICFISVIVWFSVVKSIKYSSTKLLKEVICSSNLKFFLKDGNSFCKKKCGAKDANAQWCDAATCNKNIPWEDMIVHVTHGGCAVEAAKCDPSENNCPADVWTCMAECPPDPHRAITEEGCGCSGNWRSFEGACVCREPQVLRDGKCIAEVEKECHYDKEGDGTLFACIAPVREVEIFWKSELVYKCSESCYSFLCVTNSEIKVENFQYSRGSFQEVIPAERGRLKSFAPAMGGFYETCRAIWR